MTVGGGASHKSFRPKAGAPAGQPPDEFKRKMARLTSRKSTLAALGRILANPDHPHWPKAFQMALERGYGKVAQEVRGQMDHQCGVLVVDPRAPTVEQWSEETIKLLNRGR